MGYGLTPLYSYTTEFNTYKKHTFSQRRSIAMNATNAASNIKITVMSRVY